MQQDISKIKEQVEQRLQEQQANKDFKDIGRVAQTKKEKSAFRLINGTVLNQLEEDGVMAYNMVKKEAVWAEIDVQSERDRGVTSGAAFLKVKIREAAPTRPKDEKAKRATYVMFLELLQNDLLECFNVEQIKALSDKYRSMPIDKVIGYFIDSSYLTADAETQTLIKKRLSDSNTNIRLSMLYGGESLIKKIINEIFGARFENILFKTSDAAYQIWNDAALKEPISEEQSKELIAKLKESEQSFIAANDKKIEDYKSKNKEQLLSSFTDWTLPTSYKVEFKNDIEKYREWAISYYKKRVEKGVANYRLKEILLQPKPNDWSWFETPKTKDATEEKKPKEKAINTKEPLAYIKRTGGYKIENYSPKGIVDIFGFSAVNYGNYVDNAWSKEHTKHFLGAICDMAEMLNIDIKKANELGKLSIAFGAKGIKGHLATYFPQTKDINLTKGNGDGSVAHEWGHYFDNVIVELDEKKATNSFASDGAMNDFEIKGLYKELMDFIYKGNDLYTPKVPMLFYAEKSDKAPQYVVRNGYQSEQKTVEIKETIEETLLELEKFAVVNKDWYYTQKRLFGYVIAAFGLETYKVPMKLRTSYFYHTSAYNLFQYCDKIDDKKIEIAVRQRTKYWSSAVELFARAWETVILKKLLDKNRVSNYLVNDIPLEVIVSESYYRPYPQGKELEYIETLMDKIVVAVKKKFDIGDFVAPSYVLQDDYIELKKDESGKTENAMVVDKVEDKKEIEFVKEDEVFATVIEPIKVEPIEEAKIDDLKSDLLNTIPLNDFEVLNSANMNILREKYGSNILIKALNELEKDGLIEMNTEAIGMRIFKKEKPIEDIRLEEIEKNNEESRKEKPYNFSEILEQYEEFSKINFSDNLAAAIIKVTRINEWDKDKIEEYSERFTKDLLLNPPKKAFSKKNKLLVSYLKNSELEIKISNDEVKKQKIETIDDKVDLLKPIVSKDDLRPKLQGVYFDKKNNKLVATDADVMVILNQKGITESKIYNPKLKYTIQDKYVDYENVIPYENPLKIKLNTQKVYDIANSTEYVQKFLVDLILIRIAVDGDIWFFQPNYISRIFKLLLQLGYKEVTLELSRPMRAVVIKNESGVFLIMPIISYDEQKYVTIYDGKSLPKEKEIEDILPMPNLSEKIPQKVIDAFETEPKESKFSFISVDKKIWRRDNKSGEITFEKDAPEFVSTKKIEQNINFQNEDLKSAINRGQYKIEQLKKANIGYPFQNGSHILNIPTVYGGNVYHYSRKEDRLSDYNLLQKIILQNETKQANEDLQPTKAESITNAKVDKVERTTEKGEDKKRKIILPNSFKDNTYNKQALDIIDKFQKSTNDSKRFLNKKIKFLKDTNQLKQDKENRILTFIYYIPKEKVISPKNSNDTYKSIGLYDVNKIEVFETEKQAINYIISNDDVVATFIKEVVDYKNNTVAIVCCPEFWIESYLENEDFNAAKLRAINDLADELKISSQKPIVQETRTEEKSEQKEILEAIEALEILAEMGNKEAEEAIDALKILLD